MIFSRTKNWRAPARAAVTAGMIFGASIGHAQSARGPAAGDAAAPTDERQPPSDDLYRRRGYGTGGPIFGLGRQGGIDQAGACADLAFARPRNCGPHGNYGVYGNGLGYGFGL